MYWSSIPSGIRSNSSSRVNMKRFGPHVLGLLLDPGDLGQVRVGGDQRADLLERERVEQLDARHRDLVVAAVQSAADQVVVDPAGAHQQTRDRLASLVGAWIVEHELKRSLGQLAQRRGCCRMAQQALGRHHDQRPCSRLITCRRSRWNYCAGVVGTAICGGCPRRPSAGTVSRALECSGPAALVPVRQQQRQAREVSRHAPAAADELVDDHLGGIDEVAELRLPDHERLRGRRCRSRTRSRARPSPTAGCCASRPAPWRRRGAASAPRCGRPPVVQVGWRWLNVPRPCPARSAAAHSLDHQRPARALRPGAQSIGSSGPIAARFSRCGASLRWTLKSGRRRDSSWRLRSSSRLSSGYDGRHGLGALGAVECRHLARSTARPRACLTSSWAAATAASARLGQHRAPTSCCARRPPA